MADVEEALVSVLANDAAVAARVEDRIHPVSLPQSSTFPALVYQLVSAVTDHSHDGPSGFVSSRFQLDCWAATFRESRDLAVEVRQAIDGFKGTVVGVVIGTVQSIGRVDDIDVDRGIQRRILDFLVEHQEVVA